MRALISARHSPMHSSALPWQLARGEKRNRAHPGPSCSPNEPEARKRGTLGNQTTSHAPSPACPLPPGSPSADLSPLSPRASPPRQGK